MDPTEPPVGEDASSPKAPSYAFSWATLGFILGALFVIALPPHRAPPPAPAPAPVVVPPPVHREPLQLTTIEAVFEVWQRHAVWDGDMTEVALFDGQTKDYSDCYEVLRANGRFYFRSIPRLTRVVVTHGVPENSPLEFTETADERAEWLHQSDEEDWKAIRESIRKP